MSRQTPLPFGRTPLARSPRAISHESGLCTPTGVDRTRPASPGVLDLGTHRQPPSSLTALMLKTVQVKETIQGIQNTVFKHYQSINQSIKSSKRHTSTREATSQRNHTGSKPRDAKRRRLGGLRVSRASASLCVTRSMFTRFLQKRAKHCRGKLPQMYHLPKEEERDPGP